MAVKHDTYDVTSDAAVNAGTGGPFAARGTFCSYSLAGDFQRESVEDSRQR